MESSISSWVTCFDTEVRILERSLSPSSVPSMASSNCSSTSSRTSWSESAEKPISSTIASGRK